MMMLELGGGRAAEEAGPGRGAPQGKRTGMVMSWEGHGEPLRMTL
jgi:hypothetical protein